MSLFGSTVPHPLVSARAPGRPPRATRDDEMQTSTCDCGSSCGVEGLCEWCMHLDDEHPRVFAHPRSGRPMVVPKRVLPIVSWLRHEPGSTLAEIAAGVRSSKRATLRALRSLVDAGRVRSWWDDSGNVVEHGVGNFRAKWSHDAMRYRLTSK